MPSRKLTVLTATKAHADELAANLRPEDAAEMMASHGLQPQEGVELALRISRVARAVLDEGKVLAILGIASAEEGTSSVWMLATTAAKKLPLAFMRVCRAELPLLAEAGGVLFNMIWANNKRALRLVKALGFEVLEAVPFGVSGLPFHPIVLRRL